MMKRFIFKSILDENGNLHAFKSKVFINFVEFCAY